MENSSLRAAFYTVLVLLIVASCKFLLSWFCTNMCLVNIKRGASFSTGLTDDDATNELGCSGDIDCQLKCPKGGFCNKNGTCYCILLYKPFVDDASNELHCSRDIDCQLKCHKGGFCTQNCTCYCRPPQKPYFFFFLKSTKTICLCCHWWATLFSRHWLPIECPKGGFCNQNGTCYCIPLQKSSIDVAANELHCSRDIDCQLKCPKGSFYNQNGTCYCIPLQNLSIDVAANALHYSRDIDCQLKCPEGGFCNQNGTCYCIPPKKLTVDVATRELHCSRDIDCQMKCSKGGFCNQNGTCNCISPQKPSVNVATNELHCSRDIDCQIEVFERWLLQPKWYVLLQTPAKNHLLILPLMSYIVLETLTASWNVPKVASAIKMTPDIAYPPKNHQLAMPLMNCIKGSSVHVSM